MNIRVGVIEDDEATRLLILKRLKQCEMVPVGFSSAELFLENISIANVSIVITDLKLPGMSGVKLVDYMHTHYPLIPLLVMSGNGTIPIAIDAVRRGAIDFLEKPVEIDSLVRYIKSLCQQNETGMVFPEIHCAHNSPMADVLKRLKPIAQSNASLFINGETGTGKEVIARAVHNHSSRKKGNFIAINCGAIAPNLLESELFGFVKGAFTGADRDSPGKIKMADGGTLFLDEVAELPLASQSVLLRVLQEKCIVAIGDYEEQSVDFRIICATHKSLKEEVEKGCFREDLYYRINVFELELPALRDRTMDIPLLSKKILRNLSEKNSTSERTLLKTDIDTLQSYHWPGNIRELQNVMERFLITGERLQLKGVEKVELPKIKRVQYERQKHERTGVTKDMLESAMTQARGNKSRAAHILDISRGSLIYNLKKFGLDISRVL